MKIFVAGGTGFVGSYLVPYLAAQGHAVRLLVRAGVRRPYPIPEGAEIVQGNPMQPGPWWDALADCDAAVNLVGASIRGRWTASTKRLIRESRLVPLQHLANAIPTDRPFALVSASAVGIYGDSGERELHESAPHGNDFLARLGRDWEAMAQSARGEHTRVATSRFGLVLGASGGALPEMAKAMNRYMGGILGPGTQWVSWIHEEDLARGILFLLEKQDAAGAYNFSAPGPVRQADMARTLAGLLHRPAGFPTPALAIRLAFGGFADALLFSQRMLPKRLLEAGFEFRYPTLASALQEILDRQAGQ